MITEQCPNGRPLGLSERVVYELSGSAGINFCMMAKISEEGLEQALRDLSLRHPLLRAHIMKGEDGMPAFRIKEGAVSRFRILNSPVQQIIEDELNDPFLVADYLVRYTYAAAENTLLATFHHAIGDGMSGLQLFTDLSKILNGEQLESLPLMPPIDSMSPFQGSRLYTKLIGFLGRQIRSMLLRSQKLPLLEEGAPVTDQKANVLLGSIENADQLRSLARDNNTTVHGVICAAIILALKEFIPDSTIGLSTAVNLRNSVQDKCKLQVQDQIAFMASMVPSYHPGGEVEFWDLARSISIQVHDGLRRGDHWLSVPLPGLLVPKNPKPGQVAARLSAIYPFAALVSNLGAVEKMQGMNNVQLTGTMRGMGNGAEIAFTVMTYEQVLHLNASFLQPTLDKEIISKVHQSALQTLGEILEI